MQHRAQGVIRQHRAPKPAIGVSSLWGQSFFSQWVLAKIISITLEVTLTP